MIEIYDNCFGNCTKLISIQLPLSLITIGNKVFYNTNVNKIKLSKDVKEYKYRVPLFIKEILNKRNITCFNSYEDEKDKREIEKDKMGNK